MKFFLRACCLATLLLSVGCVCEPEPTLSHSVTLRAQETGMWCWAASGEMTMDFLGANVSQCDEANKRFGRTDCCNTNKPAACIDGGWPEYEKYGFKADRTSDAALTWKQVQEQIYCRKKPFAFSWHWPGGGGHMMVVSGYTTVQTRNGRNSRYVYVKDPWPPVDGNPSTPDGDDTIMLYSAYVSSPGNYTHWDDFYNITKQ